jgi:hypothetical protein
LRDLLGTTGHRVTPLCCRSAIPTDLTLYRAGSRRSWRLRLERPGT